MTRPSLSTLALLLAACEAVIPAAPDAGLSGDAGPAPALDASVDRTWQRAPAAAIDEAFLQLPSSGAGSEGVAVRVTWPRDPLARRYREGAPVVIDIAGGHPPGTFGRAPGGALPSRASLGVVSISWVMPGGTDATTSRRSGGTYDYRGPACAEALADVVRFASGALRGRTDGGDERLLAELVPYEVLGGEVGIVALSNGGNLAIVALDEHGDAMSAVRWLAGWENPVGDQIVDFELSGRAPNPHYVPRSCTPTGCEVDTTTLAVVPSAARVLPSWDSPPEGAPVESVTTTQAIVFDDDGDGRAGAGEYTVTPRVARLRPGEPLRGFVSRELREAMEARGLAHELLASVDDTITFWEERDAGSGGPLGHYEGAVAAAPHLRVLVLATATDHGQPRLDDHPLAFQQYEGWRLAGASFVRLNPDAVYLDADGFAEAPIGLALEWSELTSWLVPDAADAIVPDAAIAELADRTHAGEDGDLDSVLWP